MKLENIGINEMKWPKKVMKEEEMKEKIIK